MQMRSENSSPIYDLYRIIGCSKNSTCDQILVEYRQKALLLHPDKIGNGVSEEEAKKNFQQLQFAKDILTNPQKRKHYDLWIDFGFFECSLEDWMNNKEKIKQTMHWGNQKEQKQLIGIPNCNVKGNDSWISSSSPISRAFKDYKI